MPIKIIMPDFGTTVKEVMITRWLKKEGDVVKKGDILLEATTDKVNVEVESFADGILHRILVPEGKEVLALSEIAILLEPGEVELGKVDTKTVEVRMKEVEKQGESQEPVGTPLRKTQKKVVETSKKLAVEESLTPERMLWMYRKMLEIRYFEEKVYYLFLQGIMPGTIHQYIGQEAVAVGVCANLRENDFITSTHRPHGHCIAKGVSIPKMMAELFAKRTGCCKGKGGSMHIGDVTVGALPAIAIVGGGIPIAVGIALAFKQKRTSQVVACFFGDGASNTGAFHEGINLAAIWDLPILFVCENNLYGASTHVSMVMKLKKIAARASAYGILGVTVEGNDVLSVYHAAAQAIQRARDGEGPTLLECMTYRLCGHSRRDPGSYRPRKEVEEWKAKDPIPSFRQKLLKIKGISQKEIDGLEKSVLAEIEGAVKFAQEAPSPRPEDALEDVYCEK